MVREGLTSRIQFHRVRLNDLAIACERQSAFNRAVVLIIEHGFQVYAFAAIPLGRCHQFCDRDVGDRRTLRWQHRVNLNAGGCECRQKSLGISLVFPAVGKQVETPRRGRERQNLVEKILQIGLRRLCGGGFGIILIQQLTPVGCFERGRAKNEDTIVVAG